MTKPHKLCILKESIYKEPMHLLDDEMIMNFSHTLHNLHMSLQYHVIDYQYSSENCVHYL